MAANLVDGFATNTITREKLANYLQRRFGHIRFNDDYVPENLLQNKNESQEPSNPNINVTTMSKDENPYIDKSRSASSDKLSIGGSSIHRTSVSSGVVLQPNNLLK